MSFTWADSIYIDWTMQPHTIDEAIDRMFLNGVVMDELDRYFKKIDGAYYATQHWGMNLTITEKKDENYQ